MKELKSSNNQKIQIKLDLTDLKKTIAQFQAGISFTLKGRVPSKKNSRCLFVRGGRIMNIPSKKYAEWHKDALNQVQKIPKDSISDIEYLILKFWAPDKRSSDLTNKAESIMDLLVDACIIKDDNWWIIDRLSLTFMGIDRKNPRCEVYIRRKNINES